MCLVRSAAAAMTTSGAAMFSGAVVLPYPGFIVSELVEMSDQIEVALECERGVLGHVVHRLQEEAESHVRHDIQHIDIRQYERKDPPR